MAQHKCENCGLEICWKTLEEKGEVAAGWTGTGQRSKYGKKWDKRGGFAWWCPSPVCQEAKERADLRHMFGEFMSAEQLGALYQQTVLDRLRLN